MQNSPQIIATIHILFLIKSIGQIKKIWLQFLIKNAAVFVQVEYLRFETIGISLKKCMYTGNAIKN